MKRYKKSFLFRYGYYLTILVWITILQIMDHKTDIFLLVIILTLIMLILRTIFSYYIIKDE